MRSDPRLGILLSQLALCIVLIASVVDAIRAHSQLSTALAQQRPNEELIAKIDSQLDALARGTQRLAQQGNPNASKIVATLEQSGVHINAGRSRK